jgi:hypothetical protein
MRSLLCCRASGTASRSRHRSGLRNPRHQVEVLPLLGFEEQQLRALLPPPKLDRWADIAMIDILLADSLWWHWNISELEEALLLCWNETVCIVKAPVCKPSVGFG